MSFKKTRRATLGAGVALVSAAIGRGGAGLVTGRAADGRYATPLSVPQFVQNMPIPPTKRPISTGNAPWRVGDCFHGVAPEYFNRATAENVSFNFPQLYPEQYYELRAKEFIGEVIPGVRTPLLGYDGLVPGPTFRTRSCQPIVVRQFNDLFDTELSTHLHGGHNPSHSDGFPNFYILPGQARDYFYTNTLPSENGVADFSECPSTCWYHDHAMDIAGDTCVHGLAGFYLQYDDLELNLIRRNVLPADQYDIPVLIQDRRFNSDGTIFYDPLDHNGYLGDVYVVNGKAFPKFHVQRRKYRFRFLNGCNARHMELRLSSNASFLGLGTDSWLYPQAVVRSTLLLSPAKRADVIIDFTNAPNEVFLENILEQSDGRGPDGKLEDRKVQIPGTQVLKFVVEGARRSDSATVSVGAPLRPHVPIRAEEIVETRVFEFHRRNGAWQINQKFFDEFRSDACPKLGTAERWILRNGSGGWWHPVHMHLESHQIQKINGSIPPLSERFKVDTTMLGPNTEAEIFMRFRTFRGPFVFHCHNIEHEDMRMMFVFDPRTDGPLSNQPLQQYHP